MPIIDILEQDSFSKNSLSNGHFTKKKQKNYLVNIFEKKLDIGDESFHTQSEINATLVLDFTSIIRRLPMHDMF